MRSMVVSSCDRSCSSRRSLVVSSLPSRIPVQETVSVEVIMSVSYDGTNDVGNRLGPRKGRSLPLDVGAPLEPPLNTSQTRPLTKVKEFTTRLGRLLTMLEPGRGPSCSVPPIVVVGSFSWPLPRKEDKSKKRREGSAAGGGGGGGTINASGAAKFRTPKRPALNSGSFSWFGGGML